MAAELGFKPGDKVRFLRDTSVNGFCFRSGLTCEVSQVPAETDKHSVVGTVRLKNALLPAGLEIEVPAKMATYYLELLP